jgi:hypothetical protein
VKSYEAPNPRATKAPDRYRLWFLERAAGVPGYWARFKPMDVYFETEQEGLKALALAKESRADITWRLVVIEAHDSWRDHSMALAVMMTVAGEEVADE